MPLLRSGATHRGCELLPWSILHLYRVKGKGAQGDGDVGWGLPRTTHANPHQHGWTHVCNQPLSPHSWAVGASGGEQPPKNPSRHPGMLTRLAVPVVILAAVAVALALSVAVALVLLAVGLLAASLAGVRSCVQVFGREKQQRRPQDAPTTLP